MLWAKFLCGRDIISRQGKTNAATSTTAPSLRASSRHHFSEFTSRSPPSTTAITTDHPLGLRPDDPSLSSVIPNYPSRPLFCLSASDPEGERALCYCLQHTTANLASSRPRSSAGRSSSAEDKPSPSHHRRRSSASPANALRISLGRDARDDSKSGSHGHTGTTRVQPSQLSPIPGM